MLILLSCIRTWIAILACFERSKANYGRCCSLSAISSVAVTAAVYAINAAGSLRSRRFPSCLKHDNPCHCYRLPHPPCRSEYEAVVKDSLSMQMATVHSKIYRRTVLVTADKFHQFGGTNRKRKRHHKLVIQFVLGKWKSNTG